MNAGMDYWYGLLNGHAGRRFAFPAYVFLMEKWMSLYRRNYVEGGTYFFTVNLLEREKSLLIDHVDVLREAVANVKRKRPFEIVAWVVLSDHLHAMWTLPEGMPIIPHGGEKSKKPLLSNSPKGNGCRQHV